MNTYFVTAYDHNTDGALFNRLNVRPLHLEGLRKLNENGNLVTAGAFLNEKGKMIGSVMVLKFETDDAFEIWKTNEPYWVHGIWESIDVKPFRVAEI